MPVLPLSTKLYAPPISSTVVARSRLAGRLLDGLRRPGSFGLISAPAGFGKTTVLCELVALFGQRVAWLSLDDGDNDPVRFWSYVIAACQGARPGLGESAQALLQSPQPLSDEAVSTLLINEVARLDQPLVLILDDYHVIQNPAVHAALEFLLEHLPATLNLVISTRVDPPWPLARFRVGARLVEIRAQDLRFTTEETGWFLNDVMQLRLSEEAIGALEARTEGWIASLQLAAISMQGRADLGAFIRAFTGSHAYVAEYLLEEVLQRQPEDVRQFLLRTSVLERMNASLCEAISGQQDGRSRLQDLRRANLFLVALDDDGEWFRYHQLFADLLRARLHHSLAPAEVAALHACALDWYERAGMMPDAIGHALAIPDYARAVRLVEQVALPMILQAHVRSVYGWLEAIPPQHRGSPRLDMAFAWLYLLRAMPAQAEPYLDRLARTFAGGAADDDPSLLGQWLAIQAKLRSLEGKPAESRDLAERALRILPESDLHVRSMLYLSLAEACEQLLDYEGAAATYQQVVRDAQATGNHVAEILGASAHARMLLLQGRLHAAFAVALQAVQRLESTGRSTPFSATLYGELGQIAYFWHRLDEARAYLGHSMQASGLTGYSDSEIYHHIMLSRIAQMAADWQAAAREMEQAAALARQIPPAMVREQIVSQQVRVDLALGRPAAAEAALQVEGFRFAPAFAYPALAQVSRMSVPLALLYNSALRVVLHRQAGAHAPADLQHAIELAGALLDEELRCTAIPAALETLLLRSRLREAAGDPEGGRADLARALQLGEPEDFISLFVEEGPPIAEALLRFRRSAAEQAGISPEYVARILASFPQPPSAGQRTRSRPAAVDEARALIEPLTPRELEVLHRIAAGDANQAIAGRLVITLSAVKKHTGSIFRKLNVNSRTQALVRARELGLLPGDR